jgi:hypothetical protein
VAASGMMALIYAAHIESDGEAWKRLDWAFVWCERVCSQRPDGGVARSLEWKSGQWLV